VPVARVTANITTLHPQSRAISWIWDRDRGASIEQTAEHGIERDERYRTSPFFRIYELGETVRHSLEGDVPLDMPILEELKNQGLTDYLALPMPFSDSARQAMTWATDRPGGFREEDLSWLQNLMPMLGLVFEVYAARQVSRTLLDTYLGPRTGRHVLEGHIRRGDGETIRAVIWLSDMRGFTAISERLPRDEVIDLLNAFFGIMARPVEARGGEILKFIGDAMLAIFPLDGLDVAEQAERAIDAAVEAIENLRAWQERREMQDRAAPGVGIALHIGDVMYGNIGAPMRLDYTVIGPAVNLVARLEGLTKILGVPLLISGELARTGRCHDLVPVGLYPLRGIAQPQEVLTIRAFAPAADAALEVA
jgi:adenylate cyclase